MKKITVVLILSVLGTMLFSCGDDIVEELAGNTWALTPEGNATGSYRTKTITLSTQTYQLLEVISMDNDRGVGGINSTLRLYFPTIGPPPTGTYSVTSIDKLSGKTNSVGIHLETFGDPSTGLSTTYWNSQENSGQTVSVTFTDGKVSATFKDVTLTQTGTGPHTGTLSANISQ